MGGVLTEAGHEVWLINRNAAQVEAMTQRGLVLRTDGVDRTVRVRAVTSAAGLDTTVSNNIMGTVWDKLLVNVATGALSGITRLPYGELYQVPELEACAVAAVSEAMAVAQACGVRLSITKPLDAWRRAGAGLPFEFKNSMLQSLEKGSVTEIDFINGAVVQQGARYGIPTPVNQTLVAAIKGLEKACYAA
jgi:2-dehydropantoate 2-reductase